MITNINKYQENVTNKEDIFNEFLENPRKILNNFEHVEYNLLKISIAKEFIKNNNINNELDIIVTILLDDTFKLNVEKTLNENINKTLYELTNVLMKDFNVKYECFDNKDGVFKIQLENLEIDLSNKKYEFITRNKLRKETFIYTSDIINKFREYYKLYNSVIKEVYALNNKIDYRDYRDFNPRICLYEIMRSFPYSLNATIKDSSDEYISLDFKRYVSFIKDLQYDIAKLIHIMDLSCHGLKLELSDINKKGWIKSIFNTFDKDKTEKLNLIINNITVLLSNCKKLMKELNPLMNAIRQYDEYNFESDESASRYEKLATLLHNLGYSCNNENFLISTHDK